MLLCLGVSDQIIRSRHGQRRLTPSLVYDHFNLQPLRCLRKLISFLLSCGFQYRV